MHGDFCPYDLLVMLRFLAYLLAGAWWYLRWLLLWPILDYVRKDKFHDDQRFVSPGTHKRLFGEGEGGYHDANR